MKRLAAALVLVLALAVSAGGARAQDPPTYSIVQGTYELPTSSIANGAGLVLPPAWTSPPAQPRELSYDELLTLWRNAGAAYGIPWNVLAAINKIESNFGRNMGPSSAGAIGWMQFMPSTWLRWGTDADGDGVANPWEPVDAVYSAARYLAAAAGEHGGDIRSAVFAYNHAWWYVNDVMQLAELYGQSDAAAEQTTPDLQVQQQPAEEQVVFTLDRLQEEMDAAKEAVTSASTAWHAAAERAQSLEDAERQQLDRAANAPLLSDRLEAQKYAVQVSFDREAAQQEVGRFQSLLSAAETKLQELQQQVQAASLNRAAARVLQAPARDESAGQYVFPVGGGAETVSVSHSHHDYPAADIAAPEGAPLYALADGDVLYAWSLDERCGTGFTMRTFDGQVWTYCHLSYRYPSVRAGAHLTAGAPVGLVGSTGHATGPHLHLQLQPAASYPQEQSWFQSFAGVAFRWQEGGETKAGAAPGSGPQFTIIEQPLD
jgi:murein DD-endopeptidase MepM/ murein hydrolase activator NlpD